MSKTAEELRRQRESQKLSFKEAQMEKSVGTGRTVQSPQSQRSYLKETQMAKQDNAARYQAVPAPSSSQTAQKSWQNSSAAANATLSFLNQNGVSTKYTQNLMQPQTAPKQKNQQYQNAAANATLNFLNQNGVSTKYTQGLMQPQPAQTQTAQSSPYRQPTADSASSGGARGTAQGTWYEDWSTEQIKAQQKENRKQMNEAMLAGNMEVYNLLEGQNKELQTQLDAIAEKEADDRRQTEAMASYQQALEAKSRGQSFGERYDEALAQNQTASTAEKELKQRIQAAKDQRSQGYWENGVYMGEDHSRDQEIAQMEAELQRLQAEASAAGDSLRYAGWWRYEDLPQMQDYAAQTAAGEKAFAAEPKQDVGAALDAAARTAALDANNPAAGYNISQAYYTADTSYREPGKGWTEQQEKNFYYLYARDKEEAYAYAQGINNQLAYQKRMAEMEKASEWAQKNVGTEALATAGAVASAPFAIVDFLSAANEYAARGTITQRDYASFADYGEAMKSGVAEKLNELGTLDEGLLEGKGLGDLYQLGVSSIQSVTYGNLTGPFGTAAVFFGNAAKSGLDDALERGATPEQALLFGMMSGLAESACEYFSIDKLLRMENPKTLAQFFKNFLKQGGVEASEEGMTTLVNTISDAWIMGDKSQVELDVQKYKQQGMSESEARKKAMTDWMNGIAWDAIGGTLSGGFSSTVQQAAHAGTNAAAEWISDRVATSDVRQIPQLVPATLTQIRQFVSNAVHGRNKYQYLKISEVSPELANALDAAGIHVQGFSHVLKDNDIRHISKRHGKDSNAKYPVLEEDIINVQRVIDNYNNLYRGYDTKNGNPTVVYEYKRGNTSFYVEEVLEAGGMSSKQMIIVGNDSKPSFLKKYKKIASRRSDTNVAEQSRTTSKSSPGNHVQDANLSAGNAEAFTSSNAIIPQENGIINKNNTALIKPGQVLQNAGTNGKVELGNENNRNTGNLNPVSAFQPGSLESRSRDGNTQNAA